MNHVFWFVTQQVGPWHNDKLFKWYDGYKNVRPRKHKQKRTNAYYLTSITMVGLVCPRGRKQTDTDKKVVEVTDSCFKII